MRDGFSTYHPAVNFMYFCCVIGFNMFFLNPVLLTVSAAGAFTYSVYLQGRHAAIVNLLWALPMVALVAIINPLFNHRGVTILFYFRNNPMTLESMAYGVAAGLMLAGVLLWFSCVNRVMTTDKFTYLFGGILPSLSLIFSMVIRFVPHFKIQAKRTMEAQAGIGGYEKEGMAGNIKRGLKTFSIVTTWGLENAIDTADSMNARGYGLPGRKAFSVFRFDRRDAAATIVICISACIVISGVFAGISTVQYFPIMKPIDKSAYGIVIYATHTVLCFMPLIIGLTEDIKWRQLQSKI